MLRIIDVSVPVENSMVTWPGLIPTSLTAHERIAEGAPVDVTNISACVHVGTHADAPFHHYADGRTIEQLPLWDFVGVALVADFTDVAGGITAADVADRLDGAEPFDILVCKTRNSTEYPTWQRFDEEYVYIDPSGAAAIAERRIRTVAFDHLAVEGYTMAGGPTHKIFLGEGNVTIIEGLNLKEVEPGIYFFCGAPIRIVGSDGAPVRAFLIADDSGALISTFRTRDRAE